MRNLVLTLAGMMIPVSVVSAADISFREQAEIDLRLELLLKSDKLPSNPSMPVYSLRIVNHSSTRSYHVIRPGRGSHISIAAYSSVEIGPPAPISLTRRLWCETCRLEMMAETKPVDPINEVVVVRPSKGVVFDTWLPQPHFRFKQPGRYEFVATYEFRIDTESPADTTFRNRLRNREEWTEPRVRLISKPVIVEVGALKE